jgi:hypothetical protein
VVDTKHEAETYSAISGGRNAAVRPDLKIAYIGLHIKCYQILEARHDDNPLDFDDNRNHRCLLQIRGRGWPTLHRHLRCASGNDQSRGCRGAADTDLLSSDPDDYDTEPDEEQGASRVRYRLQEIGLDDS